MLVKLTQGFATWYDGKKHRTVRADGRPVDVPDEVAGRWLGRGIAVPVEQEEPEPREPEAEPQGPETAGTYGDMTASELRAECRARGIKAGSANKGRLVELLEADDAVEPYAPEA